jgi:tetrahydromethanopterin S-methyltransferase subunit B
MAVYTNVEVHFIHGCEADVMEAKLDAYITTLDSTTHPVLAVVPYRDGVLVISGA